ncbi:MAG: hypothetical protein R3F37_09455 [Candidatus Competibacteraceae bacterium]
MMRNVLLACIALSLVPVVLAADPGAPNLTKLQQVSGTSNQTLSTHRCTRTLRSAVGAAQIVYLSEDGGFAIQGDLIDLSTQTNLTENRRNDHQHKAIDAVGENNMVIFAPDGESKQHTVSIFTDIGAVTANCIARLPIIMRGITVRYLMFPRARRRFRVLPEKPCQVAIVRKIAKDA